MRADDLVKSCLSKTLGLGSIHTDRAEWPAIHDALIEAVLRLSASGEKTGQLGQMLTRAADYYDNETDSKITTLTSLIEPLIIIILGVLVAFILIAMYLPLFELVGTL